jgi:hypothetical protein
MTKRLFYIIGATCFVTTLISCSKDSDAPPPPPPPSGGQSIQLNGGTGGANAVNSVYLDLSTGKQDSVKRTSWDLGFYCGSDFRVIINRTTAASVKPTAKNDINAIVADDTLGFADALRVGQGEGAMDIIDDVDGDLSKTAIAAISAEDADNKVYILSPSNGMVAPARDFYKIRITRNGNGYRVQYAKLSEQNIKTIDVGKDDRYNFRHASLETGGIVNAEPAKANWDILWTLTTYKATATIPYTFSDFVYINALAGVQAAEVLTSAISYEEYNETHVAGTTFSNSSTVIGSNWRSAAPPPAVTSVKTDRFYVIKDVAGNIYKLKFVSFASGDGGERGKPELEYKLVKAP